MLTSRSFITVLHFTLKLMPHFELIFVKGVRSVSRFIFYMWISSYSSTICGKEYLCSVVLPSLLCQKSVGYIYMGSVQFH